MPSNLTLLVVILAGYLFVHACDYLHYRAKALEGHRLVVEASIAGLALFILFRPLILALQRLDSLFLERSLQTLWFLASGGTPYSGTLLAITTLAIPLALFVNLLYAFYHRDLLSEEKVVPTVAWWRKYFRFSKALALEKASANAGNQLLMMLDQAAKLFPKDYTMIGVTMTDRKLYVGWVVQAPQLVPPYENYFSLLPVMSGHRDEKLRPQFNFFYPLDPAALENPDRFVTVLPVSSISNARLLGRDFEPAELGGLEPEATLEAQQEFDFTDD
jgi:hypothetical protein